MIHQKSMGYGVSGVYGLWVPNPCEPSWEARNFMGFQGLWGTSVMVASFIFPHLILSVCLSYLILVLILSLYLSMAVA